MPNDVKFGIRPLAWITADTSFQDRLDWIARAEEKGFDSVHRGDRLLAKAPPAYGSTGYEVTTALTSYANKTESLQIGPLIYVVPFRHPVRVAKIFGTLDRISEGRVVLGVGTGWNPHEFDTLDIPRSKRGQRLEEGVEIIKELWTEDHVDYHGDQFSFENATIEPKPLQDPHPPIWFASFGPQVEEFNTLVERVLERVGRLGDGWVPMTYSTDAKGMTDSEKLGDAWDRIEHAARNHGRDPTAIEIIYSHWSFVMSDEDEEKERCKEALSWWFDGSYEEAKDIYLIGTPEEVVEQIREQTAALPRVDRYIFTPFTFDDAQMDRISERVIPLLQDTE